MSYLGLLARPETASRPGVLCIGGRSVPREVLHPVTSLVLHLPYYDCGTDVKAGIAGIGITSYSNRPGVYQTHPTR